MPLKTLVHRCSPWTVKCPSTAANNGPRPSPTAQIAAHMPHRVKHACGRRRRRRRRRRKRGSAKRVIKACRCGCGDRRGYGHAGKAWQRHLRRRRRGRAIRGGRTNRHRFCERARAHAARFSILSCGGFARWRVRAFRACQSHPHPCARVGSDAVACMMQSPWRGHSVEVTLTQSQMNPNPETSGQLLSFLTTCPTPPRVEPQSKATRLWTSWAILTVQVTGMDQKRKRRQSAQFQFIPCKRIHSLRPSSLYAV